ncbi:MAG TPA: hypothetical protein VI319_15200, partial [Burkholderiales bacterium]
GALLAPYTAALQWLCARAGPLTPAALDHALAHPPPDTRELRASDTASSQADAPTAGRRDER